MTKSRAATAAFFLFAAGLVLGLPLGATRAEASPPRSADATALNVVVPDTDSLDGEVSATILRGAVAADVDDVAPGLTAAPRLGFAEDLCLLEPEPGQAGFAIFGRETCRCERTYARNNPLKYVDPDGKAEVTILPPPASTLARWTPEQRAAENLKNAQRAEAAARGELVKTRVEGSSTLRAEWERTVGPVPAGQQLDHIVDRQLSGTELTTNGQTLDPSVNTSNGVRTANAIKGLEPGTAITSFKWTMVGAVNLIGYVEMAVEATRFSLEFKDVQERDPSLWEVAHYLKTGDRTPLSYD